MGFKGALKRVGSTIAGAGTGYLTGGVPGAIVGAYSGWHSGGLDHKNIVQSVAKYAGRRYGMTA